MADPLISIVIPTRQRPDTLEVCLRAMRHHRSPLIEVLVQDNCSSPETRDVVAEAQQVDGRVRYARAPYPTSQRHNFELGLAAARGAYMSIIGDDDSYCPGSLDWLAAKLQDKPVDAVRWRLLHYVWPSLSTDDEGFANLYPSLCFGGSTYQPAAPIAERALAARTAGSWENILVYHGMISRGVYDRMRAMSGGVFFPYPMPEVYAHNVIALFCDHILQVDDIVSIYGTSGHSAGSSWSRVTAREHHDAMEGRRWMRETVADEVAQNVPWQPDIRTLRYHDFSAYKLAESYGMLGTRRVDHRTWIKAIAAEIRQNPWQATPWLAAEERAPFDAEVFSQVKAELGSRTRTVMPVPGRKFTPDSTLPVLRVGTVDAGLSDDVEGIALAVARVTGDVCSVIGDVERYRVIAEPSRLLGLITCISRAAILVQRCAPGLSASIMRSGYLPKPVKRFLKSVRWPPNSLTALLARRLADLHAARRTQPPATMLGEQQSLRASG
jgi:glycosyltransferase involved in cell wall biosynthesis